MRRSTGKVPKKRRVRRGFFLRGLAVVLPAVLTIFVFVTVGQFASRYIAGPTNRVIYAGLDGNSLGWTVLGWLAVDPYDEQFLLPRDAQGGEIRRLWDQLGGPQGPAFLAALDKYRQEQETFVRDHVELGIDRAVLRARVRERVGVWAGILIAAGLVLSLGYLASGFIGRGLIAGMDRTLARLPVVRSVYPHAKQLVDFFLADNELEFDAVVAVPYPSTGIWSLGFVTGSGLLALNEATGKQLVAIYIPSSPVPMTGYTILLEAERLIPMPISVEEAFRMVVSAGVLVPEGQAVEGMQETMAQLGVRAGDSSGGGAG